MRSSRGDRRRAARRMPCRRRVPRTAETSSGSARPPYARRASGRVRQCSGCGDEVVDEGGRGPRARRARGPARARLWRRSRDDRPRDHPRVPRCGSWPVTPARGRGRAAPGRGRRCRRAASGRPSEDVVERVHETAEGAGSASSPLGPRGRRSRAARGPRSSRGLAGARDPNLTGPRSARCASEARAGSGRARSGVTSWR